MQIIIIIVVVIIIVITSVPLIQIVFRWYSKVHAKSDSCVALPQSGAGNVMEYVSMLLHVCRVKMLENMEPFASNATEIIDELKMC